MKRWFPIKYSLLRTLPFTFLSRRFGRFFFLFQGSKGQWINKAFFFLVFFFFFIFWTNVSENLPSFVRIQSSLGLWWEDVTIYLHWPLTLKKELRSSKTPRRFKSVKDLILLGIFFHLFIYFWTAFQSIINFIS